MSLPAIVTPVPGQRDRRALKDCSEEEGHDPCRDDHNEQVTDFHEPAVNVEKPAVEAEDRQFGERDTQFVDDLGDVEVLESTDQGSVIDVLDMFSETSGAAEEHQDT